MAIYAISDLHLSFRESKPMDIFGNDWENHVEKIKENWEKEIKEGDTVLLPGDFSWAMKLEETLEDFSFLNKLPGRKILLKGNHDYWWTTLNKMREFLKENQFEQIDFLQNNSYCIENTMICGTRLWTLNDTSNSKKMLKREIARLELSLKEGIKEFGEDKERIVCTHYPPISNSGMADEQTMQEIIHLLQYYSVKLCIYGHLHGESHKEAIEGEKYGIQFRLVSGDYIDFKPVLIK